MARRDWTAEAVVSAVAEPRFNCYRLRFRPGSSIPTTPDHRGLKVAAPVWDAAWASARIAAWASALA
jgi:hypothetical protein